MSTIKRLSRTALSLMTAGFLVGTGTGNAAEESTGTSAPDLADIGAQLESARRLPASVGRPTLQSASESIEQILKDGLSRDRKNAARFLSGELDYSLGALEEAAKKFKQAEKNSGKTPFADDAAFAHVLSLEAMGKDKEAAKAWLEWEKKYKTSSLLPEVRLARTWNALRRNALAEAGRTLRAVGETYPWMRNDSRYILAVATAAYLDDRPEEAVSLLQGTGNTAAHGYLEALCLSEMGEVLRAAARFQETAERFPESPLRDYSLLAKANTFLTGGAYRSAAEEFLRVVELASRPEVRVEAELRHSASVFLAGDSETGATLLAQVARNYPGTSEAARAQFLLGEVLYLRGDYEPAILEFNRVLTDYFEHDLASAAQYRVGRCLDALDRQAEATSTYQAVVSGYPLTTEAPAAAYLAGVGLMDQDRPLAAVPYFQLVLDRYAVPDSSGTFEFASAEHQELVEASLCLLELSYHRAGNLGQLSGMPHVMLQKMPPSNSPWRAYALLIDADAQASQGRYTESQGMLERLIKEFPEHPSSMSANRLLAWTYARQGKNELAISTEEAMLSRYAAEGNIAHLSSAYLNKAHVLFNNKKYKQAALAYEDFLNRFPSHESRLLALYQAGLCYLRLDQAGNATDRWEALVAMNPSAPISEKAWMRAGDVYFQAEHYDSAKRCYRGLMENFSESFSLARSMLRLAQCEYNSGNDAGALEQFSRVMMRFPETETAREAERGIELALYRLGQNEGGAEVLAKLVETYPTSPFAADAQFRVAMHHYQNKEYDQAAVQFRRVVSQFPGYSAADQAYFLMGDAYTQAGSVPDALMTYEQFMLFFPESELRTTARFRLGSLRFEKEDYMRAAIDFTSVLDTDPDPEIASASLFNLALCRRMLGQNTKAALLFEKYRSKYPRDSRGSEVAYQLGDIHDQAGRTKQAVKELKRALSLKPSSDRAVEMHYRLGVSREQMNDVEGALAAYTRAVGSRDKSNAFRLSALARAAVLYEDKGKIKNAVAAYQDLIRNSEDPELIAAARERVLGLKNTATGSK